MSGTDGRNWMPPARRTRLIRNRVRNVLYVAAGVLALVGAIAFIILSDPAKERLELVTATGAEVELCAAKAPTGEAQVGANTMTLDGSNLDDGPLWVDSDPPSEQRLNVRASSFRATVFDEDGAVIDTFTNTAMIAVDQPWGGLLVERLGEEDLPSYERVSTQGGC